MSEKLSGVIITEIALAKKIAFWGALFFVTALIPKASTGAEECKCPQKPEIQAALNDSSVCFVGRVDKITKSPFRKGQLEVRFSILRRLKTPEELSSANIIVHTPDNPTQCGFQFAAGSDYLVYANGTPAHLKADVCGRTNYLDNALGTGEVDELMKIVTPK